MDVNAIFNVIGMASELVILQDQIAEKNKQIQSVLRKRCGNCFHWMKSSCVPEKIHKKFKSCNSIGCVDFSICPNSVSLYGKFYTELEKMKESLKHLQTHNES